MSIYILLYATICLVVCGYPLAQGVLLDKNELPNQQKRAMYEKSKLFFCRANISTTIPTMWALLPVIGFSCLTLILRVITKFNIPLKYSSWPVWIAVVLIFVLTLWSKKYILLPSKSFLIGALIVVAVCGLGYFLVGAKMYRGYDVWDMGFYLPQAQFLIEYPVNLSHDSIPNQPWLALITGNDYFNTHRISRGLYQGFITVVGGLPDASYTMGLVLLTGSLFIYCASVCILEKIQMPQKAKIPCAVWAATVPGALSLALDGFLGSSLSVGFTMIIGYLVYNLAEDFSIKKGLVYALILAAATTVYTEMTYIYVGISIVTLAFAILCKKAKIKKCLLAFLTIFAAAFLMNIQYLEAYIHDLNPSWSIGGNPGLDFIYEGFGFQASGLSVLFFGIESNRIPFFFSSLLGFGSVCLLLAAITGLLLMVLREKLPWTISLLCIAAFPVVFISSKYNQSVYQFYRMLLQASPVLILGICYFTYYVTQKMQEFKKAIIGGICFIAVFSMINTSINTTGQGTLSDRKVKFSQEDYEFMNQIAEMKGKDIYLISSPGLMDLWSIYYGRKNNIWLGRYPWIHTIDDVNASYFNVESVPVDQCDIVYTPGCYQMIEDTILKEKMGVFLTNSSYCIINSPEACPEANQFYISAFCKELIETKLKLKIAGDLPIAITLFIANKEITVSSGQTIEVPITLQKGLQAISISSDHNFMIRDWKIGS